MVRSTYHINQKLNATKTHILQAFSRERSAEESVEITIGGLPNIPREGISPEDDKIFALSGTLLTRPILAGC